MKLDDAVALFLSEKRPTTAHSYGYVLQDLTKHIGAARPVESVSKVDMKLYMQWFGEKENVKSPATLNKQIKTLRTFFNWCVEMDLVEQSPAAVLKYRRRSAKVDREKVMPDATLRELLAYTRWNIRADALVRFLAETGCRIGGAANLQLDDLSLSDGRAMVTEKGAVEPRPVYFGDECRKALDKWLIKREGGQGRYVFSPKGNRLNNASLGQYFRRACAKAQIGSWGPHSLRHRKGHQLADANIPPPVAAKVLGHTSYHTTMQNYYPESWARAEEAARQLSMDHDRAQAPKIVPFDETGS